MTANLPEVGDDLRRAADESVLPSVQRIAGPATPAVVSLVMMLLDGLVGADGLRPGDTRDLTPDRTWSGRACLPIVALTIVMNQVFRGSIQ
ncbi:hypothetical protein [Mesorhizobium wenxiniae]|uniref:Uncharacterized protein n=1 Tax=Mesorhizobium wenxiniae TaxID=2014805 RepID=A0A271K897_9HYPH|nr:hypothetical protein [Mesorhizobium wenxiniae]PAP91978.1 hypothetical protein CIT31_28635 [Mesorhizobium wenxiniae]